MADGQVKAETQTKDAKVYTIAMGIWMVVLIAYGVLTLMGFFR
jgi:hypothetical protein